MKNYHVYILADKKNGTLYTGVTGGLANRIGSSGLGIFVSGVFLPVVIIFQKYNFMLHYDQ